MRKIKAIAFLLFVFQVCASAQNAWISGKVSDGNGDPLPGVVVAYSGTSTATMTNAEGSFKIERKKGATLEFSCLGMQTETVRIGMQESISVTLQADVVELEGAEIVSIGYGSVAKRDLTGSVASVNMNDALKAPMPNFDQILAGRVAGVVVASGDGAVGAEASITIRGNNSLTQSSAPLYVIDGFPSEGSMATALNPADIESIDILKDASATAIYGARGANGVIVITTKSGREGKTKINLSASFGRSGIANKVALLNSYEFALLQQDIQNAMSLTGQATNFYFSGINDSGELVYNYYTPEDYRNVDMIDWQDKVYRTSMTRNYNLSVDGGNKESGTRYSANLSALDQGGIIVNSNFKRYQAKLNLNQKIGDRMDVDFRISYSNGTTNGITPTDAQAGYSASGWLIYSVWGYRPVKPLYQGSLSSDFENSLVDSDIANANDYRFNPALTVRNEYRKRAQDYLNLSGAFNWEIIDGLKLSVSASYMSNRTRRDEFNGRQTYSGYEGSPSGSGINALMYHYETRTILNDNTLTYNKTIAHQHHLQALAGVSMQAQKSDFYGTRSTQMKTESLGILGINTGQYQNVTPYERNWSLMSGLLRVLYNYKYIYYLTVSARADGSSRFPVHNRWGFFPSASAAWTFTREPWLKDQKWLTNGKIRFSWGLTGNNRTTTPYDYYSQMTTTPGSANSYDYVFNGEIVKGYYPSNMANQNLKWETTGQTDLGLDLALFDNRVKLTVDLYLKNTRDLLLAATLPGSSGYTSAMINVGSMQNKGIEITLDFVPVKARGFQWNTSFNLAVNRNIVTALANNQYSLISTVSWDSNYSSQYPYITQVGKPSGMMYGYIYERTYKAQDFQSGVFLKDGIPYLENIGREGVRPGDPKYKDINGDGVVNDNDRTIIGCGQPLSTGGWSNTLLWKGIDLNIFFQWSYGNDVLNANRLIFENSYTSYLNQFASMAGRWHAIRNPDSDIPGVHANGMYIYSSRVIEDASYLRLKNLSIGYTFPKIPKYKIENLRVYVSAENLLTITNYSGPDPEVSTRNSVLTPGFDWSAYPRARSITGGLSINF